MLDALIIAWLRTNTGVGLRARRLRPVLDILSAWGAPHHRTPAQVEEQFFGLIRGGDARP